jgi:serine protease
MASPHVAGVVALMKAVCPTLTPAQVDAILSSGGMTVDIGAAGRDDLYGHGLVDALKAVQSAETCGATLPTTLGVSPGRLDFGLTTAPRTLVASKNGTGTLGTVTATDDAEWLSVTGPGGDGLGTWTATVDRTGLTDGVYSATLTFSAGESTVLVPVTVQVGGVAPGPGDVGHLYVVLTDGSLNTVALTAADPTAGQYTFSLAGVPAGSYYLFAGTDFDGDDLICDPGEACGAYPDVASPGLVEVSQDHTDLAFTAGFEISLTGVGKPVSGGLALPPRAAKGTGP